MEDLLRACQDEHVARPAPVPKRPLPPGLVNSFEYSMSSLGDGPNFSALGALNPALMPVLPFDSSLDYDQIFL
jgi:hypothetical protein